MTKAIYRFEWDCGRSGSIEGLFVASTQKVAENIGREVSFGEALGKHSDVHGILEEQDLTVVSEDQEFIKKFCEIMGDGTISGYNPLEYIDG